MIGAYRETYGYGHPSDPIGPEPSRETPDQRAAWHQAFAALGSPGQPDVRAMADGRLWLLRDTYTTADSLGTPAMSGRSCGCPGSAPSTPPWARSEPPPEAAAARKADDHGAAERHEALAASYRDLHEAYQRREHAVAQAMADRQDWEQATADSRHLAIAADAELRRRHPDQKIKPLRSTEASPRSLTLNATANSQRPGDLDPRPDRAAPCIPRETHRAPASAGPCDDLDWSVFSGSLLSWSAPRREAILQPPKPEITPSATIFRLAPSTT